MGVKPSNSMDEGTFQDHVIDGFKQQGYTYVSQSQMDQNFNRETAIDEQTLIEFLTETQPMEVAKVERHGVRGWHVSRLFAYTNQSHMSSNTTSINLPSFFAASLSSSVNPLLLNNR